MESPPLLESLAYDPILSKVKLIAEAWDAGGGMEKMGGMERALP